MTGAAPVPVPPPRPVVTNTMSAPSSASISLSVSSRAACRPTFGSAPGAEPLGQLCADLQLVRRRVELQRLQIRIDDDELDAVEAGGHHAIHGVAAAAADAHDLDAGACADLIVECQPQRLVLGVSGSVSMISHSGSSCRAPARGIQSVRKIP